MKKKAFILFVLLWSCFFEIGNASDFLVLEEGIWFDPKDETPVQVIVECKGMALEPLAQILYSDFQDKDLIIKEENDCENSFLQIKGKNFFYSDILKLKRDIELLKRNFHLDSLASEIPLAVRVCNLVGHNDFISAVSGVPLETIEKIEKCIEKGFSLDDPLLFRYFLDDHLKEDPEYNEKVLKCYEGTVLSKIPVSTYGHMPLYIPGESVVFHARTFHQKSVLGKYNPGLVNSYILQALTDNKYLESLFWNDYAPGAMAKTVLLKDLTGTHPEISELQKILNDTFPNGWVLKGVCESSSGLKIITNSINLLKEWETYKTSDFEDFVKRTYTEMKGFDEDIIYEKLRLNPCYLGWRISQYLEDPSIAIVQERINIDKEYRVDVVGGFVLGNGSTLDRHNDDLEILGLPVNHSSPELFEKIESVVQSSFITDALEPSLKESNFAFDIFLTKSGQIMIGESNPGSECGFLQNELDSILALNKFLKKYPRMVQEGKIKGQGLTNKQQKEYLQNKIKTWAIELPFEFPKMNFSSEEIRFLDQPIPLNKCYLVNMD
jgi:hypothetical protein